MSETKNIPAKIIRVITIPPIMVTGMILILHFAKTGVFHTSLDAVMAIVTLGILPVLAYPMQKIIPKLNAKGRDGQRSLAFVMSIIGYTISVIYGLIMKSGKETMLIFLTYFFSVIILTFFNKVVHVKASGHACSITAPLVFLVYFIGVKTILPCILIAALVVWSSLQLKRHTVKELTMGAVSCLIAFLVAMLLPL